jgi:hypothetical protein
MIISLRPPPERAKPRWRRPLAIVVALVVVAVVVTWAILPPIEHWAHDYVRSPGGVAGPGCLMPTIPAPAIAYDEQLLVVASGNSSNVTFHVPAVVQTDSNGYGPGYLVNGLTSAGYWYQVGISYDWPCGSGYLAGFHFFSEVWGPGGTPVSGPTAPPIIVGGGDSVNLSLRIVGPNVVMSASNATTGANQSTTYSAENSTSFVGGLAPSTGWFTGAMTEWYHAQAYYGGEQPANYTALSPIAGEGSDQVTLRIDEIVLSGGFLFDQVDPVVMTCACYYPFSYEGASVDVGPASFVTGA